jgi:parallel beta-helix repeat protein
MNCLLAFPVSLALTVSAAAATYHVDGAAANAADANPGTEVAPWKTISRAAAAKELAPGDTVLIRSGVYREHVAITVSGAPERPVTFAAAPGCRVVIKGSEIVRGTWSKVQGDATVREPYPNAFTGVWKIPLGDEFFADPDFQPSYADRAKRWVSQVFIDDEQSLQRIGPDPIYTNEPYAKLACVGRDLSDIIDGSFYFDAAEQTLYIKHMGDPSWFNIEVGVRGFGLTASKIHDVVIRGLEVRHNRQPGGQWPMASLNECERVLIEGCRFYQADFCGLSIGTSRNCTVRDCEMAYNGNTGFSLGQSEDCTIEDSRLLFNNTRRFHSGWHAGGMKCIPANRRITVQRCEVAYNVASDGIWFDADNAEIRILDNVSHHNDGCGIFFEINPGGGLIANNLCYANRGRGIYVSGSQKTWVVHNTLAVNGAGIVCMPREDPFTLEEVNVLNNLLIRNYVTQETITRGCDLTLFMNAEDAPGTLGKRRNLSVHSDYNLYANSSWVPFLRHQWNPNNTLPQWQERFAEDLHSQLMPVAFETRGTGFKLLTTAGLDVAGPLPAAVAWTPPDPRRVGCARTQWP